MNILLTKKLEGLLFYFGEPVSVKQLASHCDVSVGEVREALGSLAEELSDRGVDLVLHDDTAQLVTDADISDLISSAAEKNINTDLTDAQSEALSVVAYLAPVEKMTIDFVRGVNSRAVLRNLSARGLVRKQTRDSTTYYKLTPDTLSHLGINAQDELPDYESTREQLKEFVESDPAADEG